MIDNTRGLHIRHRVDRHTLKLILTDSPDIDGIVSVIKNFDEKSQGSNAHVGGDCSLRLRWLTANRRTRRLTPGTDGGEDCRARDSPRPQGRVL